MKEKKIDGFEVYEVEDAAMTLQRAFEIQQMPKLFKPAGSLLKKKAKAAQKAVGWSDKIK